jgi:hypothetical protein
VIAQSVERRAGPPSDSGAEGIWNFSLFHSVQTYSGAQPASYPMDTEGGGGSFPVVKRTVREADHSPPSSAQFKNGGAVPPLPHIFHGTVLN